MHLSEVLPPLPRFAIVFGPKLARDHFTVFLYVSPFMTSGRAFTESTDSYSARQSESADAG